MHFPLLFDVYLQVHKMFDNYVVTTVLFLLHSNVLCGVTFTMLYHIMEMVARVLKFLLLYHILCVSLSVSEFGHNLLLISF